MTTGPHFQVESALSVVVLMHVLYHRWKNTDLRHFEGCLTKKNGLGCAKMWAVYDPIDEMSRTWVRVKKNACVWESS